MLPSTHRLTTSLFRDVFSTGRLIHSGFFMIKARKSAEMKGVTSRFAVSVSKKVAKTAVLRNRIRRRGYAALATLPPFTLPIYAVCVAKSNAVDASVEELSADLHSVFVKIGCLE